MQVVLRKGNWDKSSARLYTRGLETKGLVYGGGWDPEPGQVWDPRMLQHIDADFIQDYIFPAIKQARPR